MVVGLSKVYGVESGQSGVVADCLYRGSEGNVRAMDVDSCADNTTTTNVVFAVAVAIAVVVVAGDNCLSIDLGETTRQHD